MLAPCLVVSRCVVAGANLSPKLSALSRAVGLRPDGASIARAGKAILAAKRIIRGKPMIARPTAAAVAFLFLAPVLPAGAAEKLVVAVNKLSAGSPLYIARAKGYFAEE